MLTAPRPLAAPAPADTDFSLTVSPTRLVLMASRIGGDHIFDVSNGGRTPLNVVVRTVGFEARKDGTPIFAADAPYSASTWVTATPASFRMPAKAQQRVTVRIAMPAAPEPGDHQLALIFSVPPANAGTGNIKLNRGIGASIYIAVPGKTFDAVRVDDLRAPGFAVKGPVDFTTTVRETGTVHHDFRGGHRLHVAVGGTNVSFPDFTVLRGSTRQVTARWAHPPLMCVCHATVTMRAADGTTTAVKTTTVIVPIHLVAFVVLGLAALVLLAWFTRRRYRAQVARGVAAAAPSPGRARAWPGGDD
jgi:hypothetical protein